MSKISIIVKYDIAKIVSSRAVVGYVLSFVPLGLGLAYLGLLGFRELGLTGIGPISASLINFVLLISGLVSLSLAALSIVSEKERGFLARVLSQPVSRREYLIGKYISILVAVVLSTAAGFGIAALFISTVLTPVELITYLKFVAIATVYLFSTTSIGMLISVASRSRFDAILSAIAIWFFFTTLYQMVITYIDVVWRLSWTQLAATALANPVEAARLMYVQTLDPNLIYLGQGGVYFAAAYGPYIWLLSTISLAAWGFASIVLAIYIFSRADI
ncbi:ABC transporter permease [Pyrobaculum ferrireducens]|uniref:ABC transporter transmembrane protein n=1 Tax=Pyrobaculum ferrireducens TaxID=1104324 RepID=G7VI98_9CREN|nr:ABC transporter permease subunit [Pyrobaculum ferrireducens]AET32190.1 ABC transporter transmembrane protein [Pyrobaculum ferrireducens]